MHKEMFWSISQGTEKIESEGFWIMGLEGGSN
jgi:hypothetical protein